jgi:hypothetical protein
VAAGICCDGRVKGHAGEADGDCYQRRSVLDEMKVIMMAVCPRHGSTTRILVVYPSSSSSSDLTSLSLWMTRRTRGGF